MRRLLLYFVTFLLSTTEIYALPNLSQSEYRWRNDDGDEVTATWAASSNTPTIITANGLKRLRLQLANSGGTASTINQTLEYSSNGGATWSVMNNNATTDTFLYLPSTFVVDGTPTTAQSTVPAAGTFVAGKVVSSIGATQSLAASSRTEYEWVIGPNPSLPPQIGTYIFRASGLTVQPAVSAYPALNYVVSSTGCYGVGSLNATNATTSTVDLGWTELGSAFQWEIEYGVGNTFPVGTGTREITGSNPHMLGITTPLSPGTTYSYFVRSLCGPNDTSTWSQRSQFATVASCDTPSAPLANNATATTADLSWTENGSAIQWEIEYGIGSSFAIGTGTREIANLNPYTVGNITPLNSGTTYSYFVRSICGPNDTSAWSPRKDFATLITNDDASGATLLTVGAGCTLDNYTNVGATLSTGEVAPTCNGTPNAPVWFSFVAPMSGAIRISLDEISTIGTFTDSRVALFSATDVNDYTTFSIISCDDDGGSSLGNGYLSVLYATDLVPNNTYYVAVDKYSSTTTTGSFCITVDELSSSMLSSTNNCSSSYQTPLGSVATYTGWVPLLDGSSNLIALVRNSLGSSVSSYTPGQYVNTGSVRSANGQSYLDRNFSITSAVSTAVDVQLFFLASELGTLQGVEPTATLAGLNITKQSTTACAAAYNPTGGTNTHISQTGNGSINGVNWVNFQTTGFSGFYIHSGNAPLVIKLKNITATNVGAANRVEWITVSEEGSGRFELERSIDGKNFNRIYEENAKGKPGDYTYLDNKAVKGINYYRLRMIDVNGIVSYSEVVSAVVKSTGFEVEAFPNPVSSNLTVKVNGTVGSDAKIQLTDVTGKLIRTVNMTDNVEIMNINGLANGIYLIKYSDANQTHIIRVSKE